MNKKLFSLLLAAVLAAGCCLAFASPVKRERVYIVTDANGNIKSITDNIRLENTNQLDELKDRTHLTDIQNIGGHETFSLDGETLLWQAMGKDIVYQGTSDKTPAILPAVKLTLDGKEVSAEEMKTMEGEAVLTVDYKTEEPLPLLAITIVPLPEEGVSNIKLENAKLISETDRKLIAGWAAPQAYEKLKLPKSFSVSFHADHAELKWMMTFASAEPIDRLCERIDGELEFDAHKELDELQALLTALKDGEPLPELEGSLKDVAPKFNELNKGLNRLDNSAAKLAKGAADLNSGLAALTENNEQLNNGAVQLEEAILQMASAQLESLSNEEGAIAPLTPENYADALDAAIEKMNPENIKAALQNKVKEAVQAQQASIIEAVTKAAEEKALEEALKAANMSAEEYRAAVKGGTAAKEQAKQLEAKIKAQLQSEESKAKIEKAAKEQSEKLVIEKTEAIISRDKAVAEKLEQAQEARDKLTELKEQLNQVHSFAAGLKAYTDGAAEAAAGASSLSVGAKLLQSAGTKQLKNQILDAEKDAAAELLSNVMGELYDALSIFDETRDALNSKGYDLKPEDMEIITAYIIRTDF
jgi:putative membrane protein